MKRKTVIGILALLVITMGSLIIVYNRPIEEHFNPSTQTPTRSDTPTNTFVLVSSPTPSQTGTWTMTSTVTLNATPSDTPMDTPTIFPTETPSITLPTETDTSTP